MIEARLALARGEFRLDVDLRLPGAGASALFGPSGCGKTTLLRALAGLERAAGRVVVDGTIWQDDAAGVFLPPHQRPLGYVIQEAALFPHLSVEGNLQYGRRRSGAEAARVDLAAVIDLLGIGALLARRPATLSGGERQRVAIARALATGARLLLMDEPLAALDPARKAEILPYLERLHTRLALPIVYVTHAMDEVARLADHLVLLRDGRVHAAGPLAALLARADLAVDDDAGAVIEATVAEHDAAYALSRIAFPGGALWLGPVAAEVGQAVRVRVPARDVSLVRQPPGPTSILNVLPVTVSALHAAGATVVVGLVCAQGEDGGAIEACGADGVAGLAAGRAAGADGADGIAGADDAGDAGGSDGAAAGRTREGAVAAAGAIDGAPGPARLLARITRRSADALGLQVGDRLYAQVKGVSLM